MTALATTMPPASIRITTDGWTAPYWEAAQREQLAVPRCRDCGTFRFPPWPFCPECRSQDTEWVALSGRASVFSFSVVRGLPGQPELLLVAAVVEFPDAPGVHLVTNLVDVDPDEVTIGMPVDVMFVDIADGWKLPVFRAAVPS
jgi:uncharacterized OB-fold protein